MCSQQLRRQLHSLEAPLALDAYLLLYCNLQCIEFLHHQSQLETLKLLEHGPLYSKKIWPPYAHVLNDSQAYLSYQVCVSGHSHRRVFHQQRCWRLSQNLASHSYRWPLSDESYIRDPWSLSSLGSKVIPQCGPRESVWQVLNQSPLDWWYRSKGEPRLLLCQDEYHSPAALCNPYIRYRYMIALPHFLNQEALSLRSRHLLFKSGVKKLSDWIAVSEGSHPYLGILFILL